VFYDIVIFCLNARYSVSSPSISHDKYRSQGSVSMVGLYYTVYYCNRRQHCSLSAYLILVGFSVIAFNYCKLDYCHLKIG